MWMIVGLGNPGAQYALNRHNIGFLALDLIHQSFQGPQWKTQDKAFTCKLDWNGIPCLLVKPQTYMNRSGESVIPLMNYYKIPPEQVCVVHDDIDQKFGHIKLQRNRGHGGHNGIRNITELLGHAQYTRLKIGVGRPANPQMNVADWVLQNFSQEELTQLPPLLDFCIDSLEKLIHSGFDKASTQFNGLCPFDNDRNQKGR